MDQPVPQEQKTIDKKALEKWVTSHTEDMQSAARSFSKLITHRSWFKTEKRLHYCINGFMILPRKNGHRPLKTTPPIRTQMECCSQ